MCWQRYLKLNRPSPHSLEDAIDYAGDKETVVVADAETLYELDRVKSLVTLSLAAGIVSTRLIDNIVP